MNTPKTRTDVRKGVEAVLGHAAPEPIWKHLVKERWVDDALAGGASTIEEVAAKALELISLASNEVTSGRRKQRRQKAADCRNWVRSEFLAAAARKSPLVEQFRAQVLGNRLLATEDVEAWINEQVAKAPRTTNVIVQILGRVKVSYGNDGFRLDPPLDVRSAKIIGTARRDTVGYLRSGEAWAHHVDVPAEGPLRLLYESSETLARMYGWLTVEATMFMLTDAIPYVRPVRMRITPRAPYLSATYITITLDPSVTPRELAGEYQLARSKWVPTVRRSLSVKHMTLAVFALSHPQLTREDHAQWNKTYPNWAYWYPNRFRKDARTAERRHWERLRSTQVRLSALIPKAKG